jgi:CelD/BcsL family acetyltransferase involved in cellulose biosynthesis
MRLRARMVGLPVHQELRPGNLEQIIATMRGSARGREALQVEVLPAIEPVSAQWAGLAEGSGTVFKTREWAAVWWRHFGQERRLLLVALRSGDRLVGLVPLYLWRAHPLRVLRFVGHGPGDELGPICAAADRALVGSALRRALASMDWDVLVGEQLPAEQDWGGWLGGRVLQQEGSPVLRFGPDGWEGFLRTRTPNFREQVRRRPRKLAREHRVRYRLVDRSCDLQRELDVVFGLHAARWPGGSRFLADERFHRSFAAVALARGWLRLWLLEADGQAVAALYGFRFAGTECYYQAGRDPAWDDYRVGFVLLVHAIQCAAEDGVAEYRLLRGGEAYKYRFATADPGLETIGAARGRPARAALMLLAGSRALPGPVGAASRRLVSAFAGAAAAAPEQPR